MESSQRFNDVYIGFRKLSSLELVYPLLKSHVERFRTLNLKDWTEETLNEALHVLSSCILSPECADSILECFPRVASNIVTLALEKGIEDHQTRYVVLGKLFQSCNTVVQQFLNYFDEANPPWKSPETKSAKSPKKRKMSVRRITDLEAVECCWNLLRSDFNTFRSRWNWNGFLDKFLSSENQQVVWVACQCVAKVFLMDESTKRDFMLRLLPQSKILEYELHYDISPSSRSWLNSSHPTDTSGDFSSRVPPLTTHLYANIDGVLLPIFHKQHVNNNKLVPVKSTMSNLQRIAIGVSTNKALGLMGPVGCGKSALVEYLASLTGRRTDIELLQVQLGEETDSKLLLGTYKCTDVPGEFIWESGILTKAVMGGHWLLMEDIESAASDVVAVLSNLLEHNTINVPGYRDNVRAAPGFHLFMTHRLLPGGQGHHRKHSTATELLEKHWLLVNVEPLTTDELIHIIQVKFPLLKTIASRMVAVYLLLADGEHDSTSGSSRAKFGQRLISTRDLLKWCTRAEIGFDVTSPESGLKVLQDAIDIFCCCYSDLASRSKIAGEMAARLGIVKTKAEYFCNLYKPSIVFNTKSCIAGRVNLPRLESDGPVSLDCITTDLKFALTRESSCLLERLAVCLSLNEPALIVGETGTGKTTTIQLLAKHTGHKLVVINMNQQSDSSDLLGGYKPVDLKQTVLPLREEFEVLFRSLFNVQSNQTFLENISACVSKRMWSTLLKMMAQSQTAAVKRLGAGKKSAQALAKWRELGDEINRLQVQLSVNQSAMAFSFIEGSLVKALKEGHWVLLDEINLACAETLQCLSGLLEGPTGSIFLLERGDAVKVSRHPNFRLLAAMNPATDFGKKDLPAGVRNRFTELFVSEHSEVNDLSLVVKCYLPDLPPQKVGAVVRFYLLVRKKAAEVLIDSTGHRPIYSLRTLCRGLLVAAENKCGNMNRSLYEALCLSFLTQLNASSHTLVKDMIAALVLDRDIIKSTLSQPITEPLTGRHICFEGYWVEKGPSTPSIDEKYLLTPSVKKNLCDIARCVSLSNHPLLIQGETSVGKTSLITYLANAAGHKCYRINNHQHTDLQEYVGTYSADPVTGTLVFREGVLVEAMKAGHWIILDELNLAPSEVLEALNRVLDDNRELFITETQETVKAHPSFRLFATQNPPGLYGGRKMLSRAFRNRFVELHFGEIPAPELETILQHRCNMPLSYCKKLVAVMADLQIRRKGSATFAGKLGFITLRDLFRWGERYRLAQASDPGKYYDWDQHIADEGYLVLAGRVRKNEERETIRDVLEKKMKRKVDIEKLFTLNNDTSSVTRHILEKIVAPPLPEGFNHIVWTYNLRKTAVLVGKALEFCEPLLLVGETGCGKTTICQLLAVIQVQLLYSVNCHQHSESSDFLGGLRPVRDKTEPGGKLFEWVDGPLIRAMKEGMMFLVDEISLADDSVLERLNSLLEPERKLMVSEKGSDDDVDITAADDFRFVGTMNPGGDFGKKELSPALRNRLTEIWCEGPTSDVDMMAIVEHNVRAGLSLGNQEDNSTGIGKALVSFLKWFNTTEIGKRIGVSVRDVLTWIRFINLMASDLDDEGSIDVATAYVHGACLTLLDGIGTATTAMDNVDALKTFRTSCVDFLLRQVDLALGSQHSPALDVLLKPESVALQVISTSEKFGIHPFYITKVPGIEIKAVDFTFEAPTTCLNTLRLIRSLQIPSRAILLEGSPGVGKTSIVAALAKATGHEVTRINLSEQTDISDLFGADLPVEGAAGGTFAWRDGPFLKALKQGHWILLDELNLASQSVVEGLNSVLDHRGEVFVPELGRTFHIQTKATRLFACQNPQRQGGQRKGLPQSFLNRFTQVFVEPLSKEDLIVIAKGSHPSVDPEILEKMVELTIELNDKTKAGSWGSYGGPYEWNLRDLNFWIESFSALRGRQMPGAFVKTIYADRLRKPSERQDVLDEYGRIFGPKYPIVNSTAPLIMDPSKLLLGELVLSRSTPSHEKESVVDLNSSHLVLRHQLPTLRSLALCVQMGWLAILVGDSYCGKTGVLNTLAQLVGKRLYTIPVSSAMDTTELLGGFEQTDYGRHLDALHKKIHRIIIRISRLHISKGSLDTAQRLLEIWQAANLSTDQDMEEYFTLEKALVIMKKRIDGLLKVLSCLVNTEGVLSEDQIGTKIESLESLKRTVEVQGAKAGGNFEWVDSVLVKCLEQGHWLVVDHVNLCSGAVLDRLNGLLEPDGVLVMSERGVGADGTEVVVKPHKDFRIFFTLDPNYGHISRAMRNRGIEIYMERLPSVLDGPAGYDDFSKFSSELDLMGLLQDAGFTSSAHSQALIHIHSKLALHCYGYETPHVGHLMDAAFLTLQNWKKGQPLTTVVEAAFTDVYLKSRTISVEQKLKLTNALSEAISSANRELASESSSFMDCFGKSIALRTLCLDESSVFQCLKHQGSLLQASIELFKTVATSESLSKNLSSYTLSDFEALSDSVVGCDHRVLDTLPFVVMAFYGFASAGDVDLRHAWIENLTTGPVNTITRQIYDKILLLSSVVRDVIKSGHPPSTLPWDPRHLSPLADWNCSLQNRLHAHICYRILRACDDDESTSIGQKIEWKSLSIMQYSRAVKKGMISDLPTNSSVVTEISVLFDLLENVIVRAFNSSQTELSLENCWDWLNRVAWKFRLWNMTKRRLFSIQQARSDSLPPVNFESLTYLVQHYKWFRKHTLPMLVDIASHDHALENEVNTLMALVDTIDQSVDLGKIHMIPLCRKMIKSVEPPSPMKTTEQCDLSKKIHRIEDGLEYWKPDILSVETLVQEAGFLASTTGQKTRRKYVECCKIVINNENVGEGGLFAEEIENSFKTINTVAAGDRECGIIKMWPFLEYVALLLNSAVRSACTEACSASVEPNNKRLTELVGLSADWFLATESIPPSAVGALKSCMSSQNVECVSTMFLHLAAHLNSSSAIRRPFLLLEWDGKPVAEDETLAVLDVCQQDPMLAAFLGCFVHDLFQTSAAGSLLALTSHRNTLRVVHTLKTLLWRNLPAIASPILKPSINEAAYLKNSYRRLINDLRENLGINETVPSTVEEIRQALEALNFDSGKVKGQSCISFITPVIDNLKSLEEMMRSLDSFPEDSWEWWICTGKSWASLGYVCLMFYSNLELIDPVHKEAMKRLYGLEELKELKLLLSVQELTRAIVGATGTWPLRDQYRSRITELESKKELQEGVAVRPYPSLYNKISMELKSFMDSLFTHEKFKDIVSRLSNGNLSSDVSTRICTEVNSWLKSVKSFYYRLKSQYYACYPDIVTPALLALSQVIWGVETALSNMSKISARNTTRGEPSLHKIVAQLASVTDIRSSVELIDSCCSSRLVNLLKKADEMSHKKPRASYDKTSLSKVCMRLVKALRTTYIENTTQEYIFRVLEYIVDSWEKLQEENRIKIAQEKSIYINKLTPIQIEEEEMKNEILELFPVTRDDDFGDLEGPENLEDVGKPAKTLEEKESKKIAMSIADVEEICEIHRDIVRCAVRTPWLVEGDGVTESPLNPSLLKDRMELFWKLMSNNGFKACESSLNLETVPVLLVALSQPFDDSLSNLDVESPVDASTLDFYHDPNVSEATQCVSLLHATSTRVGELLAEWPDHPTLKLINEIILRISGFSITSPISRFLSGLELLLTRLHEWEENAHDSVSLARHAASVTNQIIAWRRLELTAWKGALNSKKRAVAKGARRWWFHLYSLTVSFLRQSYKTDELVSALQTFMEASSLGEFETRLQLLLTFHCHSLILPFSDCQRTLNFVFWNTYRFYRQFAGQVSTKIVDLGNMIEKKLKEFVKIARWNDINYWAVKAAVEKTHKTVHKHIKEYEKMLQEPASCAMTRLASGPAQLKLPSINFVNYLTCYKPLETYKEGESEDTETHILRLESLLRKCRRNCKEIIVRCSYPKLLNTMNVYLQEWREVGDIITQFEIDPNTPEEKKRATAKVLLQRKRRTVADLLKTLAQLGLSYRSGLLMYEQSNTDFALIPPLDVKVALTQLSSRSCDPDLVSSWKDTEDLFLSAVAQYAQLKRHLNHPHKDLGPVTVEKVKGFTASLTNLARETKESLCSNATELYSIRCILFQLTQVSENNVQGIDHSACRSNEVNIMNCLDDVIFTLKQFSSILNACPAQENFVDFKELTIFPPTQNQPLVNAHKSDQNWNRVKSLIDSTVKMATKLKEELRKWNSHQELAEKSHLQVADGVDVVINDVRAKKTTNCIARLKNTADTLRSVIDLFSSEIDGVKCSNPLSSCVEVLVEQLSNLESVCTSAELPKDIKDEEIVSNFTGKVNRLVHKVLIAVQNLYKIHVPSKIDAPTEQNGTNNEEEASGLEDGHLKEKLVGSIATDFRDFRISDISNDLKQILLQLKEVNTSGSYIECLSVLRNAFPLLDQLSCLYQFFVVQQTSTLKIISKTNALLLGVFTEFAKNGYNVPDDLREEGEEGESEGTKGGMGLGEGEGEKDVSDQIESLDQLEDAKRPEDYKNQKEEQKDCKEEEKGIDMEEDIDGELQDIDKKPDDEEGEEDGDDKEDPDKEMGDTEKGAEALDKEVWGSDSEEEDNDDLSDDEGNRGSEQTEKELGAKTGDDEDGRQDDKDDKRQHDQKKPEINEMEEPEVDDDHVDPYHGNQPPTPEVEPLDIPENLDMDGDDSDEDQDKEGEEENPFDIDKMKEQNALDANPEEGQDEKDDDENGEDDSNRPPDDIVDDDEDDGKDFDKPDMIQDEPDETEPDEQPEEDQEKEPEGLQDVAETEELEKEEEASGDAPQADKPSDAQAEASEDQKESSDQVASKDDVVDEKSTQKSDTQNDDGKEEDGGAGVTEPDETNEGGRRGAAGKQQRNKSEKQQEDQKRQRPGDSNIERSLGEVNEPAKKKLKTIEAGKGQDDEEREQEDDAMEQDDDADLYQHIKEAQPKAHDTQVIDAATKEQAAEQKPVINKEDEQADPLKAEDDITEMDEDENDITEVDAPMPKSDSKEEREKNEKGPKGKKEGTVMEDANIEVEIEGELVQTLGAARAPDSTYHTQADQLIADDQFELLTSEDVFRLRQELQEQLASWNQPPANEEASEAWEKLCSVTSGLSRDLCEQLRLVLEPTTASGLKGDFRTGRRINMRKVIPYIASQFRKDKIWLRRSKPSKREYQVVMAIDDSSSMADNQSKELAFESLALVSRALTLLEAGDLAVLSFGESVKVLHELGQPFTDHSGTRLVQQLTFDQKRTKVGALVDFTTALLASCAKKTDADVAQLLVILSDGRGVMSEGEAQMLSAVRNAKHNRVFMIFVIIENPNSKDSILDIRQPCFKDGRLLGITSYMDNFPFPFYLILRDIASLPSVLSDALRQWFELVATSQ